MSHFAVTVVIPQPFHNAERAVADMLDPFDETKEVPHRTTLTPEQLEEMRAYYMKEAPVEDINAYDLSNPNWMENLLPHVPDWNGGKAAFIEHLPERNAISYISNYNPLSKWDWWQIGGRFRGSLWAKPGAVGMLGEAPLLEDRLPATPDRYDVLLHDDIDFEGMGREELRRAQKEWRAHASHKKHDPYHCIVTAPTRKAHLAIESLPIETFAIVDEEGWHERGHMGWFGMWDEDSNPTAWAEEYRKRVLDRTDNPLIVIVDCHI